MAWSDKGIETTAKPWSRRTIEGDSDVERDVLASVNDVIYGVPGGFGFLTEQQQAAVNQACRAAWLRGSRHVASHVERIEEAFTEGFWARQTYNDSSVNDVDDEWKKAKANLLRSA